MYNIIISVGEGLYNVCADQISLYGIEYSHSIWAPVGRGGIRETVTIRRQHPYIG